MAHSDCGWTCGCAGKTVRSLENTCLSASAVVFTTKRRHIKCMYLYHAMSLSTWANVAQKQLASSVDTAVEVFKRCIHLIYRLIVVNHHRRSAQVWHVLSRDFSVLPAHPHVHPQSEWAIPAFAFPAAPLFITLNKGVWLESSKTNVVDSLNPRARICLPRYQG